MEDNHRFLLGTAGLASPSFSWAWQSSAPARSHDIWYHKNQPLSYPLEYWELIKKNWSERRACDQQCNLGRPLFWVFFFLKSFKDPLYNWSGHCNVDIDSRGKVYSEQKAQRERERTKFPLAPMGVLAPGSERAHAWPSAQSPIDIDIDWVKKDFFCNFPKSGDSLARLFEFLDRSFSLAWLRFYWSCLVCLLVSVAWEALIEAENDS